MIAEPIAVLWTPLCMEPDELARWQEMRDRSTSRSDRIALPCRDCLAGFAIDMRALGRCNGTPNGVEEDTEMDQPDTSVERAYGNGETFAATPRALTRRVELEVAAPPCGSCSHEPVCALRAAFEGMATVETSAPPLPDGLRLALSASVACAHFLRDRAKPAPVRVLTSQERGQANGAEAYRKGTHEWTPEQRAAQGDRMRARNLAAREGVATG